LVAALEALITDDGRTVRNVNVNDCSTIPLIHVDYRCRRWRWLFWEEVEEADEEVCATGKAGHCVVVCRDWKVAAERRFSVEVTMRVSQGSEQ
jgi:hypothetical protein